MTRKGPYRVEGTSKSAASLGERVAQIRKAWGWTQTDLATRLCVQKATVSAWERETAHPNGISLIALAAVLNTTPEALLGESRFSIPTMLDGVAEPNWQNHRLPPPTDATLVLVVNGGSVTRSAKPSQLKRITEEAIGEGKHVWLVIG